MKTFWIKKEQCTACGACDNICPVQAIKMVADKYGFKYPIIEENCIDCNLCETVCNRRKDDLLERFHVPEVYATWSLDKETRYNSTSGGIFSEIARNVFRNAGYVSGAEYDINNLVGHTLVQDEDGLDRVRQSKYLQSNINNIYKQIQEKLQNNILVAFCGAPCQVAGLYAFLGKEYENLITIDFICRGVNSPKAYRAWLDEVEGDHKSKAKKVWFKYKVNGWKNSPRCTRVDFDNGTYKIFEGNDNTFMCGYLGPNLYIRPSCGDCEFKGIPRQGDITLADFWGIKKELDDDNGTSMILLNSQKGNKVFEEIKEYVSNKKMNLEEITEGNACFCHSVKTNPKSKEFLEILDDVPFSIAIRKYSAVPVSKMIWNKIKKWALK